MAQRIDCWTTQDLRPDPAPGAKCRCTNCGADLWHISQSGEVSCADCDEPSTRHCLLQNNR